MNTPLSVERSTFVTVLGWILVALSALALLSSLVQGVLLEATARELLEAQPADLQPPGEFLYGMFRGISLINVVLTGLLTYAAYAFLRRRNWARRTFLVLFAIGLAGNVMTVLMFGTMSGLASLVASEGPSPLPAEAGSLFKGMFSVWAVCAIGTAVLLGWLIKRLRSPAVRAEFNSAGRV